MNAEIEKLVSTNKLAKSLGENLSALEPGTFCFHKSWGAGKVAEWDLLGERIIIDFEGKPGHSMKLEFAAKSVDPLVEDHILAAYVADPEASTKLALEDPVSFVRQTLANYGRVMTIDSFEDTVKGRMVPEGKFKSWWDGAKKKLRQHREFVVPSKRTLPLELRAEDVSVSDVLIEDIIKAKDPKSKVKALEALVADLDSFADDPSVLAPVVKDVDTSSSQGMKLHLQQALEMILARDEITSKFKVLAEETSASLDLIEVLRKQSKSLASVVPGLTVGRQRKIYESLPDAFGEGWLDEVFSQLRSAGQRGVSELTRFVREQKKEKELLAFLKNGLQQRSLSSEVLAWVCKERKGHGKEVFSPSIAPVLISSIEKDYYDEESKKSNRLHDLFVDDHDLIPDLLSTADRNLVRNFTRRLLMSPVFEELNRRSILARVVKTHPDTQELITGSEKHEEVDHSLIVSWESLKRRQAELDELVTKKIPENSKEIQIAREYGDLRENFEFKAAKEMQSVLNRRRAELEQELNSARGTDFADAASDSVSIGTIVTIKDSNSGQEETFTILGAWDTDTDNGIISYLSSVGDALLEAEVGEEVELSSEANDDTRMVSVVSIEKYNKG